MSNQVFVNKNQKFLPSVGLNIFEKDDTVQTIGSTGTSAIVFEGTVVRSDNDVDFEFDGTTITILEDGLYQIYTSVTMEDASSPTANDVAFGGFIYCQQPAAAGTGTLDIYLDRTVLRVPARGSDPGSNVYVYPMSGLTYMRADTTVDVRITNYEDSTLNVIAPSTLGIQRIA
jgi:hypothetical protein